MTPLERLIREAIESEGPMRLDRYVELCLGHPQFGYYMTRDPFGAAGDFVTAPEISQMFGELIGVWCANAWTAIGSPNQVNVIELGPGRGTLMADLVRATRIIPEFAAAVRIHLVETSPVLRAAQCQTVGEQAQWHNDLRAVPDGPAIVIANEFFDAIPTRQYERRGGDWFERRVGIVEGKLALGLSPMDREPADPASGFRRDNGESGMLVIEDGDRRNLIATEIGGRLVRAPGAALIIDYGHIRSAAGDTLQAVRQHEFCDIFELPGEADLTAHVDFESLAGALGTDGASVHGPITQRDFLLAMGIEARAERLAAKGGGTVRQAMERLAGEAQMGNLFKIIAATSPGLAPPYPFFQT